MKLNDKRLRLTSKRMEAMEQLGIEDTEALLHYYPFRYEVLNAADPSVWKEKEKVTFQGTLAGRVSTVYFKGRAVSRFQVTAGDEVIHVTIYNRPWAKTLKDGDVLPVDVRHQLLGTDRLQNHGQLYGDLALLTGLEHVHDTADGVGSPDRMQA